MENDVARHYDMLIDMGDDPARDPDSLREYMDKWDGEVFIAKMNINPCARVLEIGVGTGRLALRVAPFCREFVGVDISEKAVARAKENLSHLSNVELFLTDFLRFCPKDKFDVVYSSLTFMHIKDKSRAIGIISEALTPGGRLCLSLDKNRQDFIDIGKSRIEIYPDTPAEIAKYIEDSGLRVEEVCETEFAYIITASKKKRRIE